MHPSTHQEVKPYKLLTINYKLNIRFIHSSSNRREQLRREVSIENKNEKKEEKKDDVKHIEVK